MFKSVLKPRLCAWLRSSSCAPRNNKTTSHQKTNPKSPRESLVCKDRISMEVSSARCCRKCRVVLMLRKQRANKRKRLNAMELAISTELMSSWKVHHRVAANSWMLWTNWQNKLIQYASGSTLALRCSIRAPWCPFWIYAICFKKRVENKNWSSLKWWAHRVWLQPENLFKLLMK